MMPALLEVARWATILLLCLVLTIAGVSDVRTRRIPNWTVLATVGLFWAWFFVGPPASLLSSLGAALIVLVCSCVLYAFGIVGAGDSKLATAVALFAGVARLPEFLFYMSLTGCVLVLSMVVVQPARVLVMLQMRRKGGLDGDVPYGVAIALAGVMLLLPAIIQQLI